MPCAGAGTACCASRSAARRAPSRLRLARRGVGQRCREGRQPRRVVADQRRGETGAVGSGQAVLVEEAGVGLAGQERRVPQHAHQQVAVGRQAVDPGPGQRRRQGRGRLLAVGCPRRSPWPASGRRRCRPCCHRVTPESSRRPGPARQPSGGVGTRPLPGTSNLCRVPLCGCQPAAGSSAYSRASIACPVTGGGLGAGSGRPAAI